MRAFDISPLLRSSIGFDHVNRLFDLASRLDETATSYPPYNIEKHGEDAYRITMAVACFRADELDVTVKENSLLVTGKAVETAEAANAEAGAQPGVTFLHRGIARRAFERRFELADTVKVTGAELKDGLLHIALKREIPEAKKPRQIAIATPAVSGAVIDAQPKAA
ncbi:Hsp20 family protein [Ferrovibrio sp.]|uniref:Hsp20 family protein n=1 Tax=Ferrovibrio sp. TaxID=1917215 RepID=UPI003120228B